MGYHRFEMGDLVNVNNKPHIIYKIEHTEEEGRLYGVLESNRSYACEKLKFVPRETLRLWRNPSGDIK